MLWMLLLALQQPPTLEAAGTALIEEGTHFQLTVSRTGKFLVMAGPDTLDIFTAADLTQIKSISRPWTTFAFDEKDEHLLSVGIDLVRIDTVDWRVRSQEVLEGQEILPTKIVVNGSPTLLPRQAYIAADGDVYYRIKGGGVAHAFLKDGKFVSEKLTTEDPDEHKVVGIVGLTPTTPLLLLSAGNAGVLSQGRPCFLVASMRTFLGTIVGDVAVCVGETYEGLYDPKTWKVKGHRPAYDKTADWDDRSRHDAVVDFKSGWVLVAEEKGLRAWNTAKFEEESRYKQFSEPVLKLALDGPHRVLYTLEKAQIRRWKVAD